MVRRADFTEWIGSVPLPREPLVSVVIATLGLRPDSLSYALRSIAEQSFQRFEVVLVTPKQGVLPKQFATDLRFREVLESQPGIGRARNAGLRAATGEYVTYADDDNSMGPDWLRAVVWAFTADSELDVAYGARLHERVEGDGSVEPAFWWFEEEWDPRVLLEFNPIDTGALAHRAALAEARWDEELRSCVDWDIAIRLTASGRVKPLPIRACTYVTRSSARVSVLHNNEQVRQELRGRARKARRLRVLGVTHSFPRFSEFYVESELAALGPSFDVAVASEHDRFPGAVTAFDHLGLVAAGISKHQPDLVLVHFADVALRIRPLLAEHGIPFALRVHSYDLQLASAHDFESDDLCLGLWVYPEHADKFANPRTLRALVHDADLIPPFAFARSGVVFTSACLPKRNWPKITGILADLHGIERTAILATCHGSEELIDPVAAMLRDADPRISVLCDVSNHTVIRTLTSASSLLYYGSSNHPIGNPRSVVEAWLCGAIPVMPDKPEVRAFAGDHARYYSDASQAVELIRMLNDGGVELAKERTANMDQARERYASAAALNQFSSEIRTSYLKWSERRG